MDYRTTVALTIRGSVDAAEARDQVEYLCDRAVDEATYVVATEILSVEEIEPARVGRWRSAEMPAPDGEAALYEMVKSLQAQVDMLSQRLNLSN